MSRLARGLALLALLALAACAPRAVTPPPATPEARPPNPTASPTTAPAATETRPPGPTESAGLRLTSPAFGPGTRIPAVYTCLGDDRIPPLRWEGAPPETASFVLIMDDPDAPGGVWDHWIVYDIPATVREVPEGGPAPGVEGVNSWGVTGYGGPCPPPGPEHRYRFTLYALDVPSLGLGPGASKGAVLAALQGHVLDQAELVGVFGR